MLSRKPWSVEATARLFITVILTLFAGQLLATLVESIPSAGYGLWWTRQRRDFAQLIAMTLCFQVATLFWIRLFLRHHGMTWREAFFPSLQTGRAAVFGLIAGAVATPALWWLQTALSGLMENCFHMRLAPEELVERLGSGAMSTASQIFVGFTAVVLAPVAEEALFRGILYPMIKQQGYPKLALWVTSLLFAAAHGNAMAFVPLAIFSMLLIWLYETSNTLIAPIMAHSALNSINLVLLLFSGPATVKTH